MLKRIFQGLVALLALLGLLVVVLALNTWRQGSRQIQVPPLAAIAVDEQAAAQSLSCQIHWWTRLEAIQPEGAKHPA